MVRFLKVVLAGVTLATSASAQEKEEENQSPQLGPGYELRQISNVVDPATFSLIGKVQWGSLAIFAPDSFEGKVPLYIYAANEFKCSSSMGGALVDGNYGVAKLDWLPSGQDDQKVPEFKSWVSRDAYCDFLLSEEPLEPDVPREIGAEIVRALTEGAAPQPKLISFGPISGGEPDAKFWAECDPSTLWEGSPCADRLGSLTPLELRSVQ